MQLTRKGLIAIALISFSAATAAGLTVFLSIAVFA
jgi:hypothetical protein